MQLQCQKDATARYHRANMSRREVSFGPGDGALLERLDMQPNKSAYIKKLISAEMRGEIVITVTNSYGVEVPFDAAVRVMDDEVREEVHASLAPCSEQAFFDAYAKAHAERFGEEFAFDAPAPQA